MVVSLTNGGYSLITPTFTLYSETLSSLIEQAWSIHKLNLYVILN